MAWQKHRALPKSVYNTTETSVEQLQYNGEDGSWNACAQKRDLIKKYSSLQKTVK